MHFLECICHPPPKHYLKKINLITQLSKNDFSVRWLGKAIIRSSSFSYEIKTIFYSYSQEEQIVSL